MLSLDNFYFLPDFGNFQNDFFDLHIFRFMTKTSTIEGFSKSFKYFTMPGPLGHPNIHFTTHEKILGIVKRKYWIINWNTQKSHIFKSWSQEKLERYGTWSMGRGGPSNGGSKMNLSMTVGHIFWPRKLISGTTPCLKHCMFFLMSCWPRRCRIEGSTGGEGV